MPAMNGSVSFRSRGRLIGCCMALVLLASALLASSASAKKPVLNPTQYLALGDSLAFGYTQEKFNNNYPTEEPSTFEGGYGQHSGEKLAAAEKKKAKQLS